MNDTTQPITLRVAEAFITRAAAQGMKGTPRDRAALEFVLGAATVCDEQDQQRLLFIAGLVATRGYSWLLDVQRAHGKNAKDYTPRNLSGMVRT